MKRWHLFNWTGVGFTSYRHGVAIGALKNPPFSRLERSPVPLLGLRYGDVIQTINGMPIGAPADIEAAAFAAIEQHLPAIEVELQRRGTSISMRYELVP